MPVIQRAVVATANGAKYARQLCKHWGHRTAAHYEDGIGKVRFEAAVVAFRAEPARLTITLAAAGLAAAERYRGVVAAHRDRCAFKEAPFTYDWGAA